MKALLAAYSSKSGDGQGYRWLWHSPQLSEALLQTCYGRLDTTAFSYADGLKKLTPNYLNGGLVSVDENWCAAYRFLHGGRDGPREKFFLVTGIFPRTDLPRLELAQLWFSPPFTEMQETCPAVTVLVCPERVPASEPPRGIIAQASEDNFSGRDAIARATAACVSLPEHQGFHLRLQGPLSDPSATLERFPADNITTAKIPESAGVHWSPPRAQGATKPPLISTAPKPQRARPFALGLMIGLAAGWCIAHGTLQKELVHPPPPKPPKAHPAKRSTNLPATPVVVAPTNQAPSVLPIKK